VRWWTVVKDILLTGTGIVLVLSQVFSRSPSVAILGAGLALTTPSVAGHAAALLSGHGGGSSSPRPQPPGPPQPPSPREATGE
jgi:hypothetical protein